MIVNKIECLTVRIGEIHWRLFTNGAFYSLSGRWVLETGLHFRRCAVLRRHFRPIQSKWCVSSMFANVRQNAEGGERMAIVADNVELLQDIFSMI